MRIAGSPTFLAHRAQLRMQRAIALIVCGLLALGAGFVTGRDAGSDTVAILSSVGVFIGLGALLLGWPQLAGASRDREAGAGEALVVTQLQARLGDDFTYLRRVTIPQHGVEADGILVGPPGALVLGIRSLDGRFVVRGNDWLSLQPDGSERPWSRSPTWEVARPLRALERAIQEQGIPRVPVQGAVVLVQGQLQEASRPGLAVVPLDRLASYVDYLGQAPPADPEAMRLLTAFLEPFAGGAPRPARLLASPSG